MESEKSTKKIGTGTIFFIILITIVITTIVIIGTYKMFENNNENEEEELIKNEQIITQNTQTTLKNSEMQTSNISNIENNRISNTLNNTETISTNSNINEIYSEIILNGNKTKINVKQNYSKNETQDNAYNKKIQISINGKEYKKLGEEIGMLDLSADEKIETFMPTGEYLRITTISDIYIDTEYIVVITKISQMNYSKYILYIIDENSNMIGKIETSELTYVINGNTWDRYMIGPNKISTYSQDNGINVKCEYTIERKKLKEEKNEINGTIEIPGKI